MKHMGSLNIGASGHALKSDDRIYATYLIETPHPLERAAATMAGEQSTGSFMRVPGETGELLENHAARVESLEQLDEVEVPSLPCSHPPRGSESNPRYRRARVVLSFPIANMGPSLPNLMATVCGNLFELREFSGLRLMDLQLPRVFGDAYLGPQFAVEGTRKLTGVHGRPIVGTIIKPSVGLSPEGTASLVSQLINAGLDFVKDDELQANGPHCPFDARVDAVMDVINRYADRTGKKPMVAFNLTDEVDLMLRHHDKVLSAGGTCVMVSMHHVGLSSVAHLRRHSQLPIHGHRNGWGMYTRSPMLGVEYIAMQKLWRLAGVDHLHCNGLRNKFWEPDDSVVGSARGVLTPLFADKPMTAMPVLASAQWAGQAADSYERIKSVDLMYVCGAGIIAHPGGVAAGVASVQQAWQAAAEGTSLEVYARSHVELAQALVHYGDR
jgi:ribulose-bisphosphate carboxylase large chain